MNIYSSRQFQDTDMSALSLTVRDDFLKVSHPGDFCFVETDDLLPYQASIEDLYLFYWNRRYPASIKFSLPLDKRLLVEETSFPGHSHDKITLRVYR